MSTAVDLRGGAVYLSAETVDTYFRGVEAVIILIRDGSVQILPVRHMTAGGCLLKVLNAAGDRVASAPDVFHANGLGAWCAIGLEAKWSSAHGALPIPLPDLEIANYVCIMKNI